MAEESSRSLFDEAVNAERWREESKRESQE
jgi:hypothetical protein